MDVLNIRNLRVDFTLPGGTMRALKGASLRVPKGKTVALVGESGSGKSVLCQAVMGILPRAADITGGEIQFTDDHAPGGKVDLAREPRTGHVFRALRGNRMAMIFQEPMTALSPMHTIGDQIGEVLITHEDASAEEARERTREMLEKVGFPDPEGTLDRYPFELSGGMRQRAVIAMALICRPSLLIADEPTTALDVTIQAQILKLIKDLQAELDMGVLFITHDLGVVANMADEVVVMYQGEVMEAGTARDLFETPRHLYLRALMGAVPRMGMEPGERLTPLRSVDARVEIWGSEHMAPEAAAGDRPVIEVNALTKRFRPKRAGKWWKASTEEKPAVLGASLTLERGKCLGLVGESGSGKTTLAKTIARAFTPDEGAVTWTNEGKPYDVHALAGEDLAAYRRKVQYVFQDPQASLNPRMTVYEILSEPMEIHKLCGAAERRTRVSALLHLVGLDPEAARRYPHAFSGGQRQRLGIARALALEPEVLILDEPVSALDVSVQAQVLNLLKDLQSALNLTYLFVGHNLAVIDYIADDVAVMAKGRLVETGPVGEVFANPAHPYTRALMDAIPVPDLSKKLDLARALDQTASDPAAWGPEYALGPQDVPVMTDLGKGHKVAKAPVREGRAPAGEMELGHA